MSKILEFFGMPEPAAAHAKGIDDLIGYVHLLMLALFVGWLAYYCMALYRFNRKKCAKADYVGVKSGVSTYLEIGVAVVEGVLLIGLAIPLWARAVDEFPVATGDPEKDPIEVRIMGMQFKWNAHFAGPDGKFGDQSIHLATATNPFGLDGESENGQDDVTCILGEEFLLPVGRPVICRISSMDVIHSFKVPAMRVTQDAVPGMTIPTHFTPTKTGDYAIICAQLCGSGHALMRGDFKVVTAEEWEAWYLEKAEEGGAMSFE